MIDTRRCPNPKVVVTRELADTLMDRMEALFDTQNNRADVKLDRDELAAAMADCDVFVPTVTDDIDAALITG
ncbi:MAG: D-glycerate dehydrogenase, partial [Sphingomonas sp.]